jgi:hypothetical protein
MFNVSMIMDNGRCIVWHGEAQTPAHAMELAITQAVFQTGSEVVEIKYNEEQSGRLSEDR